MLKLKITDDSPEVILFKKHRLSKREFLKKEIKNDMAKNHMSPLQINDFLETVYDNMGNVRKKFLSPLHTSFMLSDQKKAFNIECKNIKEAAKKVIAESNNFKKCSKIIKEVQELPQYDKTKLKKLQDALTSQGPSWKIIDDLNQLKTQSLKPKISRYADSMAKYIIREIPALKGNLKELQNFIFANEDDFKLKYKNTMQFHEKVDLTELKNACGSRDLLCKLPSLLK